MNGHGKIAVSDFPFLSHATFELMSMDLSGY